MAGERVVSGRDFAVKSSLQATNPAFAWCVPAEEILSIQKFRSTNTPFAWSRKMSTQPVQPSKTEKRPEKNTDATALLSPDELRAISGGAGAPVNPPPGTPVNTGPQPNGVKG
jgi:hypothetical protein